MQQQQLAAAGRRHQRQSKSLERTWSERERDAAAAAMAMASSYPTFVVGDHHPERIYHIGSGGGGGSQSVARSQSTESAYVCGRDGMNISGYGESSYEMHSNESLARAIEQPTCVECRYQRKPS